MLAKPKKLFCAVTRLRKISKKRGTFLLKRAHLRSSYSGDVWDVWRFLIMETTVPSGNSDDRSHDSISSSWRKSKVQIKFPAGSTQCKNMRTQLTAAENFRHHQNLKRRHFRNLFSPELLGKPHDVCIKHSMHILMVFILSSKMWFLSFLQIKPCSCLVTTKAGLCRWIKYHFQDLNCWSNDSERKGSR